MKAEVTERHQRVKKLRAEGLTWPQISERLGITERQARWAAKTEEERKAIGGADEDHICRLRQVLGKHKAECPACARRSS